MLHRSTEYVSDFLKTAEKLTIIFHKRLKLCISSHLWCVEMIIERERERDNVLVLERKSVNSTLWFQCGDWWALRGNSSSSFFTQTTHTEKTRWQPTVRSEMIFFSFQSFWNFNTFDYYLNINHSPLRSNTFACGTDEMIWRGGGGGNSRKKN